MNVPVFIDISVILQQLGISRRKFYRMVASQEFPPPVKMGRSSRWPESDLTEYINRKLKNRNR